MRNICIIPARSGSKGLKDKNIKELCGKPLIAYTIEAAIKSDIFDVIMVSTDSPHYADIAKGYGAEVPFLRSGELSSDKASSWDVVKEVLMHYKELGQQFDNVFLLQPTSPLRESKHITEAFKLFSNNKANYVVGVCEVDHSPLWCNTIPEDLSLNNFIKKEVLETPRQALPKFYRINGAIYIVNVNHLLTVNKLQFDKDSYAFIMDKKDSVDIDDELDFEIAGLLISKRGTC